MANYMCQILYSGHFFGGGGFGANFICDDMLFAPYTCNDFPFYFCFVCNFHL